MHLIKTGDKVGASQATLLSKLGIKPFKYGLQILQVRPVNVVPLLSKGYKGAPQA